MAMKKISMVAVVIMLWAVSSQVQETQEEEEARQTNR